MTTEVVTIVPSPKGDPGPDFIEERTLLERIPVTRKTAGTWRKKGWIPYVAIGRRVLYHWPTVEAALLHRQSDVIANERRR